MARGSRVTHRSGDVWGQLAQQDDAMQQQLSGQVSAGLAATDPLGPGAQSGADYSDSGGSDAMTGQRSDASYDPNKYARGGSVRTGYANGGEVDDQEFYQPAEQQRLQQEKSYGYQDPEIERRKAARTGHYEDGGSVFPYSYDPDQQGYRGQLRQQYNQQAIAEEEYNRAQDKYDKGSGSYGEDVNQWYARHSGGAGSSRKSDQPSERVRSDKDQGQFSTGEDTSIPANARPTEGQLATGYTAAGTTQPSLSDVITHMHNQLSSGGTDTSPTTGYNAGGYGGDLTSPPPKNALEAGLPPESKVGPPLSLQSPAPPSISGQATSGVAATSPSSLLGRRDAVREATPAPSADDSISGLLAGIPGKLVEDVKDKYARSEQYGGTDWFPQRAYKGIKQGLADFLRGDKAETIPELQKHFEDFHRDPTIDLDPRVQRTFDDAVKRGGVEEGAKVVQALRKPYNDNIGTAVGALGHNDPEAAARFADQAHNLMPNNLKQTTTYDPNTGMFNVATRNSLTGEAKSYQLKPDQFHAFVTGPAGQFDHVAANGTDRNLQILTNPYARAPGKLPEGTSGVQLPGGQTVIKDQYGRQQLDVGTGGTPSSTDVPEITKQAARERVAAFGPRQPERDPSTVPVGQLSPQELYAQRQQLMGDEDPRAAMQRQQFQQAVAPGRAYPSDEQREKAARDYWAQRQGPSNAGGRQVINGTVVDYGPDGRPRSPMIYGGGGFNPIEPSGARTGVRPDGVQYTDRPAVPGTNWQDPRQYTQDPRAGVRGNDAQGRPMPMTPSIQTMPSTSPAGGGTADIGPQPTQQTAGPEQSRPATKADEPWFSTEGFRGGPPLVRTPDDLAKLPRGARFRAPDGTIKVKT